jgi:hypothetical protein
MATAEILAIGGRAYPAGLQGVKGSESIYATVVTAPSTKPGSYACIVNGSGAKPVTQMTMAQTDLALSAGGVCMQLSATSFTAPATVANSLMVAQPQVPSAAINYPVGSYYGFLAPAGSGAAGAAGLIAGGAFVNNTCPSITATSVVKCWLVGATAAAMVAAGGIVAPVVTIQPGTGFTLTTASNGATYGYEVLFG